MIERLTDRFDALAERHSRLLVIAGAVLFVLSCASYAGFIELPDVNPLSKRATVMIATFYNAVWWGFINPRVQRRRAARATARDG